MKPLHEIADELCPYRLDENYAPEINDILDECLHDSWIVGFIAGAQWREDNPVASGSVSDPESDPIELCGLLWDRENLAIGGYKKNGRHYYTWHEAIEAARSVGKRLPTGEEWTALCDLGSTWDAERKGRWFGGNHDSDHKGSLFLPAAGWRNTNRGELANTNIDGLYWSSFTDYVGSSYAGYFSFYSGCVYSPDTHDSSFGFSVRCVRDK